MFLALPGTPSSFTLIPALQYGEASDMPPWSAQLHLDLLSPSPLPTAPAPAVIYLRGDSAGGHLAALLGLTGDHPALEGRCGSPGYSSRIQAVVTRSAPYDFLSTGGLMINDAPSPVTQLFGGIVSERENLMRVASPIFHVRPGAPAFQIVHGTLDETVPFEQAEQFTKALKAAGNEVDFLPIPGAYHNLCLEELLPWTDKPWEEMGWKALAFFQRHLCH